MNMWRMDVSVLQTSSGPHGDFFTVEIHKLEFCDPPAPCVYYILSIPSLDNAKRFIFFHLLMCQTPVTQRFSSAGREIGSESQVWWVTVLDWIESGPGRKSSYLRRCFSQTCALKLRSTNDIGQYKSWAPGKECRERKLYRVTDLLWLPAYVEKVVK